MDTKYQRGVMKVKTFISNLLLLPKSYCIEGHMDQVEGLLMNHPIFGKLYELEQAIQPVLTGIEEQGLVVSSNWLTTGLQEKRNQLARVGTEINGFIGESNDVVENDNLRKFWDDKDLPVANSFGSLKKYRNLHPTFQLMMEYKSHQNYLKMWNERLREKGISVTGGISIKATWQSFASYTGRITARNLPLTSMPIAMRDYVVSPKGYQIYSLDLDNAELRFLSHFAKCGPLIEQFTNGIDVHAETAKLIRKSLDSYDINEDRSRMLAKQFTYSLLYGASKQTISKNMRKKFYDVTSADVDAVTGTFYQKYPELLSFLLERGKDEKLLTSFGCIKPVAEFKKTQRKNFTMQSSVSIAIKILLTVLAKHNIKVGHVIHDEAWILVPTEENVDHFTKGIINEFKEKINEIFQGIPTNQILTKEKIGGKYNE